MEGIVAKETLRRRKARRDLASFIEYIRGDEPHWHDLDDWQKFLCDLITKRILEKRIVGRREAKGVRALIHAPPQYGKTICVSHALPAIVLGIDPLERVRELCYNETKASEHTGTVAGIIRSAQYQKLFPETQIPRQYADGSWSTLQQLALHDAQPSILAMGLGSGTGGTGAGLWIGDDPYKNRDEAFSATINNGIWARFNSDVLGRVPDDADVLIAFHRHRDVDLAGRLLETGNWEEWRFSARGGEENDILGRRGRIALSTRMHTLEQLDAKEKEITPHVFAGLYEGRPRGVEGELYKSAELYGIDGSNITDNPPLEVKRRIRYWDRAGSESRMADLTAGGLQSRTLLGLTIVESVVAGRWNPFERDEIILATARRDREVFGEEWEPSQVIERQIGVGGKEADAALARKLSGFKFYFEDAATNKFARHQPFYAQHKSSNVRWVRESGLWLHEIPLVEIFDSLCAVAFDENGKSIGGHDDIFDTLSGGFNRLSRGSAI